MPSTRAYRRGVGMARQFNSVTPTVNNSGTKECARCHKRKLAAQFFNEKRRTVYPWCFTCRRQFVKSNTDLTLRANRILKNS